jgi:hypothetical protein
MSPGVVRAVWEDELDRLELEVLRVERMLGGAGPMPADSWTPPAVRGPIPDDLVMRARDLLERQERASTALREALASAHKQIAFGTRVSGATTATHSVPVYLDLRA